MSGSGRDGPVKLRHLSNWFIRFCLVSEQVLPPASSWIRSVENIVLHLMLLFCFSAPQKLLLMLYFVVYLQGSVTVVFSNCGRKHRPNGDPKEYQGTSSVGTHVATYPQEGNAVR